MYNKVNKEKSEKVKRIMYELPTENIIQVLQ